MTVSNETLRELSDALDRFDAEKLAAALATPRLPRLLLSRLIVWFVLLNY